MSLVSTLLSFISSIGTDIKTLFNNKVDKEAGKGLSSQDFTYTEKLKLATVTSGATPNSADSVLLNRANHTGTQPITSVTGLQTVLDDKQPILDYKIFISQTEPVGAAEGDVWISY